MGCLYLEIEGQSCLVGSVDQGLMKNRQIDLLDRRTQKRARKKHVRHMFPIATFPGIFQQITPKNTWQTFWPNYRLSIAIGLGMIILRVSLFQDQRIEMLVGLREGTPSKSSFG